MRPWRIICAPFQCGCDRDGGQLAPEYLLRLGIRTTVGDAHWFCRPLLPQEGAAEYGVRNYAQIVDMCAKLREEVAAWRAKKERVLILGGDHAIALGSIAGVHECNPNVGVIWFDAHGDVNTEATSPSANAHGMPVAALMGLCQSGLNDIIKVQLKPQNVFWIGARDLDEGEVETIERLGIMDNVYSTERVHEIGMDAVMKDIKQKMEKQGVETVHLSFDIDGMDPSIVWATGTRVENGLTQKDLDAFIEALKSLPKMESMDFVEYNPLLDDEEHMTGKWCVDTMSRLMNN